METFDQLRGTLYRSLRDARYAARAMKVRFDGVKLNQWEEAARERALRALEVLEQLDHESREPSE